MTRKRTTVALALTWLLGMTALGLPGCGGGGRSQSVSLEPTVPDAKAPWAERLDRCRNAATLAPSEPYWPYAVGALYVQADSMAEAETWLHHALEKDPAYGPALSLLSEIYYREGRHEEGVALLEASRAAHPEGPPELLADLVLHQEALGNQDAAQALLQNLKESPEAATVQAFVLLRGDDFAAASEPARHEVERAPESAVHQNNYGITLLHAGDPIRAKEAFLKALSLDPLLPGPLYNLALVERFYFMDEEAGRKWFDRYRDLSQADPDGLHEVFYPGAERDAADVVAPDSTGDAAAATPAMPATPDSLTATARPDSLTATVPPKEEKP